MKLCSGLEEGNGIFVKTALQDYLKVFSCRNSKYTVPSVSLAIDKIHLDQELLLFPSLQDIVCILPDNEVPSE